MELTNNDLFYSRLPVNEIPLSDLFTEEHLFYKIPVNWHVVITDIKKFDGCNKGNMNDRHVHFVDGAEGGYTNAARVIKQKYGAPPL